ncbi:unnamed protein product [Macrosiphum euphorbiae]|uniref:Uncharacterized protein n=1 Tax=Macrosiphum euphorbiae TaxID=13131 RepID=A0AAV0WFX2_9HEMI|nr:unnamed protein product [Macrosiphum euphorbiae]
MKCAWRQILSTYKETGNGSKNDTLQKQDFPRLLQAFMTSIEPNQSANLKAGFKKCGIYPASAHEILKSFTNSECDQSPIVESFKSFLKNKRNTITGLDNTTYQCEQLFFINEQ